jgi:hypothetical protein
MTKDEASKLQSAVDEILGRAFEKRKEIGGAGGQPLLRFH